jgi:hypothetical protein
MGIENKERFVLRKTRGAWPTMRKVLDDQSKTSFLETNTDTLTATERPYHPLRCKKIKLQYGGLKYPRRDENSNGIV